MLYYKLENKVMKGTTILKCSQKIILFMSDVQYYVPIKLCKAAGSIHLFKITGILMPDKVKINKHYIWDILEVDWKETKVKFNGKVINLPKSINIKL